MNMILKKNVCLASFYKPVSGGRIGTVNLSPQDFFNRFGNPHLLEDANILFCSKEETYEDNKVSVTWTFQTPRGPFEVRDYWWNGPNELSIAGGSNNKLRLWAIRYLKSMGIPVNQPT